MHIKKNIRLLFWLGLGLGVLAGCSPANTALEPGCSEGGTGVYSPEDVQCHLARLDPGQVQHLDPDTALLLAAPGEADNWAGAAILYHFPSKSMLAFDEAGDPDPQTSRFSSRAGLAALSELAGDAGGMAAIKQQVQQTPFWCASERLPGIWGCPRPRSSPTPHWCKRSRPPTKRRFPCASFSRTTLFIPLWPTNLSPGITWVAIHNQAATASGATIPTWEVS